MVQRRLLFISSILVVLISHGQVIDSLEMAQDTIPPASIYQTNDSTMTVETETADSTTIETPKRFLTPSFSIDYGKLLTNQTNFETKYEGGIELLFMEKFLFIGEIGSSTLSPEGAFTNGIYESNGTYYRLGVGYLGPKDAEHTIGISMRYGSSSFDESGRIFIESASGAQESVTQTINRSGLTANWWELVMYTDKQLFKNSELLWIGLNLRLRILQSYDDQEEIDVYAIPGYGRSFDKTIPAANFFIKAKF